MRPLTVEAPAKLNLFLNVRGRRADGYHLIDSLFAFVGLADRLRIEPAEADSFAVEGEWALGLADDNLVLRARDRLREAAGAARPLAIRLDKRIPVAAGLGGGSADAAAALKALNRALGLDWPLDRLMPLAARLGADVPACLMERPVLASGIGEELSSAPAMPACGVLLANPRVATPTPAVFKAFRERHPAIAPIEREPLPDRFDGLPGLVAAIAPRGNDLLPAAIAVTPVIGEVLDVLQALPDSAYAGLSGSGATCFALFGATEAAAAAEAALREARPDWWTWSGGWA